MKTISIISKKLNRNLLKKSALYYGKKCKFCIVILYCIQSFIQRVMYLLKIYTHMDTFICLGTFF